jgi:hypothetical protein
MAVERCHGYNDNIMTIDNGKCETGKNCQQNQQLHDFNVDGSELARIVTTETFSVVPVVPQKLGLIK